MTRYPSISEVSAKELASDALENAADCTERTMQESRQFVRSNPIPAVLGALAAGVVIGLLIPRREMSARERYIEGPLDELRDVLQALRGKVSTAAGEQYDTAASVLDGAIKKAKRHLPRL